jgi:predicted nucleotidyltransferase
MSSDLKELLDCLNQHRVKYVIVGGYAVMKYTEPRYTKDVDLLVEASVANSKKVVAALTAFGAPVSNLRPTEFSEEGTMYFMGIAPARVDILTRVKGAKFADIFKTSQEGELFGVKVRFISKANLIKTKKAAGRPQDLLDLEKLSPTQIHKKRKKPLQRFK